MILCNKIFYPLNIWGVFHTQEHTKIIHKDIGVFIQGVYTLTMTSPYVELSRNDARKIINSLPENRDIPLDADKTKILRQDLIFAKDWQRLICEDYSSLPYRKADFLSNGNRIVSLHYSADPYETNNFIDLKLDLNAQTVIAYLKFYYDYYRPEKTPLKPIFQVDDMQWQDDLSPSTIQSLERELKNYPIINPVTDGFKIVNLCAFGISILEINFFISLKGKIKIESHRVLMDDLPLKTFP